MGPEHHTEFQKKGTNLKKTSGQKDEQTLIHGTFPGVQKRPETSKVFPRKITRQELTTLP